MGSFHITRGFDIRLAGKPAQDVRTLPVPETVSVHPMDFPQLKQRLKVAEGDHVARGTELLEDKRDPRFKLRSPAAGRVVEIIRGERRFVEQVVIAVERDGAVERFPAFDQDALGRVDAGELLDLLLTTGYLGFVCRRPFSRVADPEVKPRAVFVNAMNTAPFRVDPGVVVQDRPEAFQAGITALGRITGAPVHVCTSPELAPGFAAFTGASVHTFTGPHPSGNTSVHISRVAPLRPHEVLWTVRACDLVQIGRLLLTGEIPSDRIVCLGGAGVRDAERAHYRITNGAALTGLVTDRLLDAPQRLISGDILSGQTVTADHGLHFHQAELTVIPEGGERRFLGWMAPGHDLLSFSRTFLSSLLPGHRDRIWGLDTDRHGAERALVLTGYYDRVMPLDIMVDFLVRAVLAGDTDEAVKLGILETDPEDFALCDFICPCKTEFQEIIRQGLELIEAEGV
jgi:Na+-transporting NADH:ubiquinone oxidoreductase subunit A